jgi:phosphoribosylaminoimidazolecarboxamide formyltransferase/IMP cyclohydrolase
MPRALISVSDKTGVEEFARGLVSLGWDIVSTGGTARVLREADIPVRDVIEVTKHPEMMDGRVKTLHPAVHAGILARRHEPDDLRALASMGYDLIELVAVNLYPFAQAAERGADMAEAMEQVDIGGPSMLRSAAKNHPYVYAIVDPADYTRVLHVLRNAGGDDALRRYLARKVFAHTSLYDGLVADYLSSQGAQMEEAALQDALALRLDKVQDLRYGENPDQRAAFYADPSPPPGSLPRMNKLQGKELSFNNLLDIDAAALAVSAWQEHPGAACVIIKHTTPSGAALGDTAEAAYASALESDPASAFGGVVAFNVPVTAAAAETMSATFLEIIIAPAFEPEALVILEKKKNLRVIELAVTQPLPGELDLKRVRGGLLAQDRLPPYFDEATWRTVSARQPSAEELGDLRFAWRVVIAVKSNAIVLARGQRTLGIGAGQMSRVDSARLAVMKANDQKFDLAGAALASDAFFPFRDSVDAAAAAGIKAVIQPGGSVRDEEVIAAADEHGIAMIFTGRRVFRH